MLTYYDIRMQYKLDTGSAPTYSEYDSGICNYEYGIKHDYIEWLEKLIEKEFNVNINVIRYQFGDPLIWHKQRNSYYYDYNYKRWLEEWYCNNFKGVEFYAK